MPGKQECHHPHSARSTGAPGPGISPARAPFAFEYFGYFYPPVGGGGMTRGRDLPG